MAKRKTPPQPSNPSIVEAQQQAKTKEWYDMCIKQMSDAMNAANQAKLLAMDRDDQELMVHLAFQDRILEVKVVATSAGGIPL